MRKFVFFVFALIPLSVFGQTDNDSLGHALFKRGLEYYQQGALDSALVLWTEIVEKHIARNDETYGNAFFNIPTVYWQMQNYDKAKEWYKNILLSDLQDNGETGDIMEPHTNYKHKSAIALARLYAMDSNYTEVLNYLHQADTLYRYWGFEGSSTNVASVQAFLLKQKTEVLLKLNRKEEAIRSIIIELICSNELEGFFRESEEKLLALLDKKSFKNDVDKALMNIEIDTIDLNNWMVVFTVHGLPYTFPISAIYPDDDIPHYWRTCFVQGSSQVVDRRNVVEYITSRSFYSQLKE